MAGRTFYKAADGSLTPAGMARAYNAELRRRGKEGMLYAGESNFGTAGKDTGEIAYGEGDEFVKNGDYIAVENEDGTLTRTKVTAENRDKLLNTRKGTMKAGVRELSQYGPYQEGQKLKTGTRRKYDNDKKVKSGGARAGGRAIVIPASFNEPSKGGSKGARVANRNMQKVLQGKPLVSKAQKAYAKRRKEAAAKRATKNKRLKKSRDAARVKTRATNARLRQRKADRIKKRRDKRELKKFNKEQRKDAQRARKKAASASPTPKRTKTRRTTTDATAKKVKKKVEKKTPKSKPSNFESQTKRILREQQETAQRIENENKIREQIRKLRERQRGNK